MPPARFWEFAHLTDAYRNMGWIDEVPRAGGLYIGGLHALVSQPDLFTQAQITHILSVLDYDIGQYPQYTTLRIQVDDDPNEDLLRHFETTNRFIADALAKGGRVFVHCAMGKSRSATIVCAYLMREGRLSPQQALQQVCEGRPICQPNPGFMEQLAVYSQMLQARTRDEADVVYQKWLKERFTGDVWTWVRGPRSDMPLFSCL